MDLPIILDVIGADPVTGAEAWRVEATVDLVEDEPVLTTMRLHAESGLDPVRLQREFRWNSPLEAISRIVPRLLADGRNPYEFEFPRTGYPEASHPPRRDGNALSTEFLEDIARAYLAAGRGYPAKLAETHHVSPRTVVSWVEKARKAGILTPVAPGQYGGSYVPRSKRAPQARSAESSSGSKP